MNLRYLSLFSGIEAATEAWHPLGWECVGVSEIDPFGCSLLAQRHPLVPNLGDVTKITEQDIINLGRIDLVVFGSPCQDLSVAGKRKGLDGARSGLFFTAMRIVGWARKHCGGRFALWENVPGAFSSNKGLDFAAVVDELAGVAGTPVPPKGWGNEGCAVGEEAMVEWCVLDAQWAGVAQRRRRVFALADFGDWASRPPILLEPQGMRGDSAPSREAGKGATYDVAPCLTSSGRGVERTGDTRGQDPIVAVTEQRSVLNAFGGNNTSGAIQVSTVLNASGSASGRMDFESETFVVYDTTQITSRANGSQPKAGDPCHPLSATAHPPLLAFNSNAQPDEMRFDPELSAALTCSQNSAVCFTGDITHALNTANNGKGSSEDGTGRGVPTIAVSCEVSPTLMSGSTSPASHGKKNGTDREALVAQGMQVRRLTPRECERLQGFPEIRKNITVSLCSGLQKSPVDVETPCLKLQSSAPNADWQGSLPTANAAGQPLTTGLASQNEHAVVHALIDLERQLLVLHCAGRLLLSVGFVESPSRYPLLMQLGSIAHQIVPLLESQERETLPGKAGSRSFTLPSSGQKNGSVSAQVFGPETNALAADVAMFTTKLNAFTKSITSPVGQNTLDCEQSLQTLCCFATAAISSCIPKQIPQVSSYDLEIVGGHTLVLSRGKPAADGPRYKALGNSMAVPVMGWIGRQIDFAWRFF